MNNSETVDAAFAKAFQLMSDAGFKLNGSIEVVVDENLPFMGYTTERWKKNLIVVSGGALKSGLLEGLLIHEMCHIYRTETKHPSHNSEILNDALRDVILQHDLREEYQPRILQRLINHVQDLYADDIAFQVFQKNQDTLFSLDVMSDFFLSWIETSPVNSLDKVKDRWMNAGTMLNNCFALSNMRRHGIPDINDKAKKANKEFLDAVDAKLSAGFDYFKNFMLSLREDVTDSEFREQLRKFLRRFVELATAD